MTGEDEFFEILEMLLRDFGGDCFKKYKQTTCSYNVAYWLIPSFSGDKSITVKQSNFIKLGNKLMRIQLNQLTNYNDVGAESKLGKMEKLFKKYKIALILTQEEPDE